MANRLDVSGAVETIAMATTAKAQTTIDKSKVPQRTIAVRINEIDYNRLNSLFTAQGTNLASAGRAAIFFLAEQVETGKVTIPNGIICRASQRS